MMPLNTLCYKHEIPSTGIIGRWDPVTISSIPRVNINWIITNKLKF